MELIKDIPFCSNANRQFKLDLCIPASVDNRAVRKHIKFKNIKIVKTEKRDNSLKIRGNKRTVTKRYTNSRGDSPTEFRQEQAVKDTVYTNTDNELDETRPSAKKGKVPFVIFVHGGGWRRGGKEAWKHYLYHDVNFLVAILQWLLNVHRNVGFSLAKSGIGCALISYPLTEQDLPYVFVEMLLSCPCIICLKERERERERERRITFCMIRGSSNKSCKRLRIGQVITQRAFGAK